MERNATQRSILIIKYNVSKLNNHYKIKIMCGINKTDNDKHMWKNRYTFSILTQITSTRENLRNIRLSKILSMI